MPPSGEVHGGRLVEGTNDPVQRYRIVRNIYPKPGRFRTGTRDAACRSGRDLIWGCAMPSRIRERGASCWWHASTSIMYSTPITGPAVVPPHCTSDYRAPFGCADCGFLRRYVTSQYAENRVTSVCFGKRVTSQYETLQFLRSSRSTGAILDEALRGAVTLTKCCKK